MSGMLSLVTVRAWFTISAIVVAALFAAVALKLFAPVSAPAVTARAGSIRLPGRLDAACWPRAGCSRGRHGSSEVATLPGTGRIRVVVQYPVQPKNGYIRISSAGHVIVRAGWSGSRTKPTVVSYDLPPGRYSVLAYADYTKTAHVRYIFDFRVR